MVQCVRCDTTPHPHPHPHPHAAMSQSAAARSSTSSRPGSSGSGSDRRTRPIFSSAKLVSDCCGVCERDVEHAEGSLNRCVVCEEDVCTEHTDLLHASQQQKGYDVCENCANDAADEDQLHAQCAQGVARAKKRSDATSAADRAPDTPQKAPAKMLPTTRSASLSPDGMRRQRRRLQQADLSPSPPPRRRRQPVGALRQPVLARYVLAVLADHFPSKGGPGDFHPLT